jgi:hypothetical protein
LGNTGNDFSSVMASGTNITLSDANGLSANVTASGNADLTAGGALIAVLAVTGNSTLTAGGSLTLSGTTTDLNTTTTGTGSTSFGTTSVGGDLSTTSAGDVSQTGPLSVTGTTLLTAVGQNVTLDNPANDFGGAVSAAARNLVLVDRNGITLGDITAGGTLGVTALTGNVSLVPGVAVSAADTKTITAPHGTVAAGLMPLPTAVPVVILPESVVPSATGGTGTPGDSPLIGGIPVTDPITPTNPAPAPESVKPTTPVFSGGDSVKDGGFTLPGVQIVRSGTTLTLSSAGETGGTASKSKSSLGAGSAEAGQTVSSAFAIVVLRTNQAPSQESAFEVTQTGDTVKLNPIENTALQALTTPGKVLATFEFALTNAQGQLVTFVAQLTETGLVIKASPGEAATVANSQRDLLVGTALLEGQRKNVVGVGQVKSVFIDLR